MLHHIFFLLIGYFGAGRENRLRSARHVFVASLSLIKEGGL